jgi:hypothetical protein
MHVALAVYAEDDESLELVLERARRSHHELPQISVVYRLMFRELPEGRNPFNVTLLFANSSQNPIDVRETAE